MRRVAGAGLALTVSGSSLLALKLLAMIVSWSSAVDHLRQVAPEADRVDLGYWPVVLRNGVPMLAVAVLVLVAGLVLLRGRTRSLGVENVLLGGVVGGLVLFVGLWVGTHTLMYALFPQIAV